MQIPPAPKNTPSEDFQGALDLITARPASSEGLDIPYLQRFRPSFGICYGGFSGTVTTQRSMTDTNCEMLITRVSAITGMSEFQTHSTRLADALRAEGKSEIQVAEFLAVITDLSTVGGGSLAPLEGVLIRRIWECVGSGRGVGGDEKGGEGGRNDGGGD